MKLLIATRNANKLDEIRAIFRISSLELVTIDDYPGIPEVVEDGETFAANAVKKAVTLAKAAGVRALADDSGLEVDALAGAPGVFSARYAGEPVSYEANNRKLLKELKGKADRKARFRCAVAISDPAGQYDVVEGKCEGHIVDVPRGDNGFGYDPLFAPAGHDETFAEMQASAKNQISHRAVALRLARGKWLQVLTSPDSPAT
jgi:XTP/dITP diphosphohydrolase